MRKQMIVIAMMSMIVTLAGCGEANNQSSITKNSAADSVTVTESSAAEKTDAESSEESKADESKTDEKKESAESKSDKKKETTEGKSDEKKEKSESKKAAVSDVTEIIGEWVEYDGAARILTVNSDASFEVRADNGGLITSGTVTVDTKDGVKKFSFNQGENGLWYVPFELAPIEGGDSFLQTEDNPAYDPVKFFRNVGDPGNAGNPIAELAPVFGTWYEEDAAIGRTITVNDDGSYTVTFNDGSTASGNVTHGEDNVYDFSDDRGLWYSFYLIGEGDNLQLYQHDELNNAVSFGRSPSTVSSAGAIDKIAGEWHPDDPSMEFTLVVNNDSTYSRNNNDGSVNTNTIGVEVRDGVVKYTFHDDQLGTWYVPFELRDGKLVTEDNPVYGTISFSR